MNKFYISIDDISPHPYSGLNCLKNSINFNKKYPKIKIMLFIPVAYWRKVEIWNKKNLKTSSKKPYYLWEYPDFCTMLKNLPDNFTFGYHGYYHGNYSNWPKSNNDEFKSLTYAETIDKINLMEEGVKKAGLDKRFEKIFRPPAWKISKDAIKAFDDMGYKLSLSPYVKYEGLEKYSNGVEYIDFSPPEYPLEKKAGELHIVYHACEWLKNYFGEENIEELEKYISSSNI